MQLSFVQKLLVLTILPLLIAQFGTLFGVMTTAQNEVRATAMNELQIAANVADQYLASRADRLQQAAQVLSADYALKEVLAFSDLESVRSALANHGERIEADFTAFVDLDSEDERPVASDPNIESGLQSYVLERIEISDAMPEAATVFLDDKVYQIFSAPVRAPTTIGYLVFGIHVGDAVASSLAMLTGMEVAVLRNEQNATTFAVTTVAGTEIDEWTHDLTQKRGEVYSTYQQKSEYLAVATELLEADSQVLLVLRKSIAEAFEPYLRARDSMLGAGLVTLTVVGLLGVWLARGIAQPIKQLTGVASKIAEGSYDAEITSVSGDEVGRLAGALQTMQSAIAERETKIVHQTLHDRLTGLPNGEQLNAAIAKSLRIPRKNFSLVCLQLSDLQRIFSMIGQQAAEEFMLSLRDFLLRKLPSDAVLFRTGTHEFFVLVSECEAEQAATLMAGVGNDLRTGVKYHNKNLLLRTSAGIAAFPQHGESRDVLIRRAKIAAADAEAAEHTAQIFEEGREEVFERHLAIANELPLAIERGEIQVHYQPKIAIGSRRVHGAEALVRWTHKDFGFMSPEEFIPIAEHTGTIFQLTQYVLDQSMATLSRLREQGHQLCMGINVSARDLIEEGLVAYIEYCLTVHNLEPSCLILEVTETSIMEDLDVATATLEKLRSMGIRTAIDDFGTGQSSMAQLQNLPLDELKVDKSFVMPMATDPSCETLVTATIQLAHKLGMTVVAEGVEDDYALTRLEAYGCEVAQGYYFNKALPEAAFTQWVATFDPQAFWSTDQQSSIDVNTG